MTGYWGQGLYLIVATVMDTTDFSVARRTNFARRQIYLTYNKYWPRPTIANVLREMRETSFTDTQLKLGRNGQS